MILMYIIGIGHYDLKKTRDRTLPTGTLEAILEITIEKGSQNTITKMCLLIQHRETP